MLKILSLLIAIFLITAPFALAEDGTYRIGICQLIQHEALDRATQGFMDTLSEKLGDKVSFNLQNASGDTSTCISIANSFIAEDVDLILANSTQALQACYASTGDIPILGASVTDYAAALDMDEWTGVTGVNVSGTSDLAPLQDQAELLRYLYPDAHEVGILYCSAEANSEYQAAIISGFLTGMGYRCTPYTFTDTNDVFSVTMTACAASDVIFVPTDNTVATCTQVILNAVESERTPIIGGDAGLCKGCGVATLAIDYYDLGCVTAEMAYEILVEGKDISTMPVRMIPSFTKVYNADLCRYLGVITPPDWQALNMEME